MSAWGVKLGGGAGRNLQPYRFGANGALLAQFRPPSGIWKGGGSSNQGRRLLSNGRNQKQS